MQNQDFDQFFSEQLQETQSFDFQEEDWLAVSNQLDKAGKPALFPWKAVAAGIILLSLFGAIAWLTFRLNDTSEELEDLKKEVIAQKQDRVDTVFQHIYHFDTIYAISQINDNTHDIRRTGQTGYARSTGSFFSPSFFEGAQRIAKNGFDFESDVNSLIQEGRLRIMTSERLEAWKANRSLLVANMPKQELTEIYSTSAEELSAGDFIETELSNPRLEDYLRPIGLDFGVSAGRSFIIDNSLTGVSSSNFGLKTEVHFVRNLSFVGGFDFYKLRYRTVSGEIFGDVPTPSSDFGFDLNDLEHVLSEQNFLQIKLGFKYYFPTKGNIIPFAGLNYLASANVKKQFYYFFPSDLYPADSEYFLQNNHSNIQFSGFGLDFGLNYKVNQHWSIQLEGYYHLLNRKPQSQYHDLIGTRMSLLYGF